MHRMSALVYTSDQMIADFLRKLRERILSARGNKVSFIISKLCRTVIREYERLGRKPPVRLKTFTRIVHNVVCFLRDLGLVLHDGVSAKGTRYALERGMFLWKVLEHGDPDCIARTIMRYYSMAWHVTNLNIFRTELESELLKCCRDLDNKAVASTETTREVEESQQGEPGEQECRICVDSFCANLDCDVFRKILDAIPRRTNTFNLTVIKEKLLVFELGVLDGLKLSYVYVTDVVTCHTLCVDAGGKADLGEVLRRLVVLAGLDPESTLRRVAQVHMEKCPQCGGEIVRKPDGKTYCARCGLDLTIYMQIVSRLKRRKSLHKS